MFDKLDEYQTLYYRGYLNTCNYTCGYCPFAKKEFSKENLQRDEEALEIFLRSVRKTSQKLNIFFTPYGEALIHSYYMEAIAGLTKQENIAEIGIQTNASFDVSAFETILNRMDAKKEKITLWCSFHPSQISITDFLRKCKKIKNAGIDFSVGMVADDQLLSREELINFRNNLGDDIYLWFNYLDGRKKPYTEEEIAFFTLIDPYFVMELKKTTADFNLCGGGKESVFIEANGRYQACNISRREIKKQRACAAKECGCYLSYSNRLDEPLLTRYDKSGRTRFIKRETKKLLFLDIDGTIYKDGTISEDIVEQICDLSDTHLLFLNTAISYQNAYKKCRSIWQYLSGGIFANGADIRIFKYQYALSLGIEGALIQKLSEQKHCYQIDSADHKLIKLTLPRKQLPVDISKLKQYYNVSGERNLVYITNLYGGKENGIMRIKHFYLSRDSDICFIGNSENDRLENKVMKNIIRQEEGMKRVKLVVAYDGTNYCGWQVQPNGITIEEVLNEKLQELLKEPIQVIGASRTDSGVHALGNVAVFDTKTRIPGEKISYALNQLLPEDVRIQHSEEVPLEFHPRKCGSRKQYCYQILNRTFPLPTCRLNTHFVYGKLELEKMKKAARHLVGEHDFKSFCSSHTDVLTTIRTIYKLEIDVIEDVIKIRIEGNGFLYNMVRIIAGTLLEVGKGKLEPEDVKKMLEACDRSLAGPTAPAKGLTLMGIQFEEASLRKDLLR